jgi:hypothetical protein
MENFIIFCSILRHSVHTLGRQYCRWKYHCTIDILFDWFGLVCFAKKLSVVILLIPNQSNRKSMVQ